MSEYSVELKGLNKVYSNLLKEDTVALKDINLQIRPGEFISIIGPSGCGKSTLLRIIGNLDKPTSGTIEYRDGADQQMGFVFQDSVLLPWKNVRPVSYTHLDVYKRQYVDSATAKELAITQYSNGADVVFVAAGPASVGVIEAAAESKKYCIGVDSDQALACLLYTSPSSPANSILPRKPRTYVTSFSGEYWVSQSTIVSSLLNLSLIHISLLPHALRTMDAHITADTAAIAIFFISFFLP